MDDFNTPNLVLPMAASYDTRGLDVATNWANGIDQRKVNLFHRVTQNQATSAMGVAFVKRNGFTPETWATANQYAQAASASCVQYLMARNNISSTNHPLIFATRDGSDVLVQTCNASTGSAVEATIISSTTYTPTHAGSTYNNNSEILVMQCESPTGGSGRAFFNGPTSTTFTEISASAFTTSAPIGKMEFLDGFAFIMGLRPGATAINIIYNSNINSLTTWVDTNYITKQVTADRGVGLAKLGKVLLAFAEYTVECFYNAGNATGSPLARLPNLATDVGMRAPYRSTNIQSLGTSYYAVVNGVLYFVGQQRVFERGYGAHKKNCALWSFDGASFKKIYDDALTDLLSTTADIFAVGSINVRGTECVYVSLTDASEQSQRWLVISPSEKWWAEYTSDVVQPINDGVSFLGTTQNSSRRFKQDIANAVDVDSSLSAHNYEFQYQFKLPKKNNARQSMAWAGVVADSISASASTTAHGNADLYISFSDNDYQSFSTPRRIDLTQRKKQVYRCGSYDDRAVRLVHSGNAECRIQAFVAKTL